MKVIHYISSIDKSNGGTTEYIRLLSIALKEKIILIIATGNSKDPIIINGVTVKFFKSNMLRWFSLLNEFKDFLENEKPDVVHINGIWNPQNWGFQKVAQKLGIKVIVSPHGMLEPWIIARNPIKKRIALHLYQKKAIKQSIVLHATAPMEATNIKALGFNNRICIIPNGIDSNEVKEIKTNYGTRKMVFLSRIHRKKGIEILLDAWRKCDTQSWTLEIAGSGDAVYTSNLIESAQDLNNVHFVGPKYGEDKWHFLRSADVLVLPTYSENFGIVIAEALAVGVPVLTTTGTPWEDLESEQCGWWIDLSTTNLKSTLSGVFSTPIDILAFMGNNGKNLVQEKYDIKEVGKKMTELYKTV